MEINRNELLVLAALLHDIGKFAQRADRPKSAHLEGEYCPQDQKSKRSTHQHVLYTDHFIERDLPLPAEVDRSSLARLAASHHKPAGDKLEELVLCRADRLSAGMDRIDAEEDPGSYKTARLLATFSQVRLSKSSGTPARLYYPLNPIDKDPIPGDLETARKTGYPELFQAFLGSLKNLPLDKGLRHYTGALVSLLEKYTWCIPSSTYLNEPDISLYDHAVTTAAIAQALFEYHKEEGTSPGASISGGNKFLLLGGDLSGIQKYIFGIEKSHGAGVAKILRARSFHLQALTRSVTLALSEEMGLSAMAKIMDAGGRFVLLLPATKRVLQHLPDFEARVQEWFFKKFKGRLSLNLTADVFLAEQDFDQESFRDTLNGLWDKLEERKLKKFDAILAAGRSPIPDQQEDFAHGACAVCRINPSSAKASERYAKEHEGHLDLCQECADQILIIGKRLPQADTRFVLYTRGEGAEGLKLFGGIRMRFAERADSLPKEALEIVNIKNRSEFAYQPVAGYLPTFPKEDVDRWQDEGRAAKHDEEVREGAAKTFSQLAEESRIFDEDGLRGKAFLGAFKADVDNLGMVFGMGLGEKLSISRFSGLSRMLNHFFTEFMVGKIRKDFRDIYVVYAGGDDIFLLGPWNIVIEFAGALVEDFQRFVAKNPDITLSAGVFVSKPTLPAHTLVREADDLLEESKAFTRDGKSKRSKNAFTLFGITSGWEDFQALLEKGVWLEKLVLDEKLNSALAMRLLGYADECRAFRSGSIGTSRKGLYLSHMAYDFKRNLKDKKLTAEEIGELHGLRSDPDTLERMRLPITYAMYRLRND